MTLGKKILYIAITALFFAGVICEFFNFGLGMTLWAISLIAGLLVFFYQRMSDTRAAQAEAEAAKEEAEAQKEAEAAEDTKAE